MRTEAALVVVLSALAARTAGAQAEGKRCRMLLKRLGSSTVVIVCTGSRPPPPAPGPETCGPDPTADALGCALTGPACP